MAENPFTECKVVHADGEWMIRSSYWSVPMTNEHNAERVASLLRGAFHAGQKAKADEVLSALGFHNPVTLD